MCNPTSVKSCCCLDLLKVETVKDLNFRLGIQTKVQLLTMIKKKSYLSPKLSTEPTKVEQNFENIVHLVPALHGFQFCGLHLCKFLLMNASKI